MACPSGGEKTRTVIPREEGSTPCIEVTARSLASRYPRPHPASLLSFQRRGTRRERERGTVRVLRYRGIDGFASTVAPLAPRDETISVWKNVAASATRDSRRWRRGWWWWWRLLGLLDRVDLFPAQGWIGGVGGVGEARRWSKVGDGESGCVKVKRALHGVGGVTYRYRYNNGFSFVNWNFVSLVSKRCREHSHRRFLSFFLFRDRILRNEEVSRKSPL